MMLFRAATLNFTFANRLCDLALHMGNCTIMHRLIVSIEHRSPAFPHRAQQGSVVEKTCCC